MDELSEEDKLTVARARKIQRFLSQPFQVAEVFTGHLGKLVPLKETIKGFKSILGGKFELSLFFFFLLWLVILNFLSSVYNLIAFFVLISFQVSMMLCPSKPSTWSVQLRRWFRKLRNWLRSTHKHPDNLTEGKREE